MTVEQQTTAERYAQARLRPFVVRALLGNVALFAGLLAMPVVVLVGYLVDGKG